MVRIYKKYAKIIMRSALPGMPAKKVVKAEKVRNIIIDSIFMLSILWQNNKSFKRVPNLKVGHVLCVLSTVYNWFMFIVIII